MTIASIVGYAACAAMFLILLVILLMTWRGRRLGLLLIVAVAATVVWAAGAAFQATQPYTSSLVLVTLELIRTTAWLVFLFALLGGMKEKSRLSVLRLLMLTVYGCVFLLAVVLAYAASGNNIPSPLGFDLRVIASLYFAVVGLVFVEQFVRNTTSDQRWQIKHLCIALGIIFVFDLYLYSDALMLRDIDTQVWAARGYVNGLVMPLFVVASARNRDWSVQVHVSRALVFHTATLLGTGTYLLAMAIGGYYIRLKGGEWGLVAQLVFLFAAIVLLGALLASGQMRARLRVFLHKHFFAYKYDYREEWLRYINTLSVGNSGEGTRERVIRATADILESPAGLLFVRNASSDFVPKAQWNMPFPDQFSEDERDGLVRFMERKHWVIDLAELANDPSRYDGLEFPDWLRKLPDAWLVIPLLQQTQLVGFLVLARPRAPTQIKWEDRDLLLTTGRQAASYLALLDANEALFTARQFEAFNRLSAFVVHDLKNLVAQLSLVVSNAGRHRNNPAFIDDALHTVENAVGKMNRLLTQLRKGRPGDTAVLRVDLAVVLKEVVTQRAVQHPVPVLQKAVEGLCVIADRDRLAAVFEHIIQNAQDATQPDGLVAIRLRSEGDQALIEIEDNGHGMDAQFLRQRLFQPFVTTKGNAGMGIGAYESREFVQSLGGTVQVSSAPGKGSTFHIRLPLASSESLPHVLP